jgi:hypothetical protein
MTTTAKGAVMHTPTKISDEQIFTAESLPQPTQFVAHDIKTNDVIVQDAAGDFYRITPSGKMTRGIDN